MFKSIHENVMVIIQLFGGLGNQLFQYAAGRAIAYRNHAILKLDISSYESQELHSFSLNHFNISAEISSSKEVAYIKGDD